MTCKHGKLKGQLPTLKPYTDVLGMAHVMSAHVCRAYSFLYCVVCMQTVVRYAVRGSSGYMNNAYTPRPDSDRCH